MCLSSEGAARCCGEEETGRRALTGEAESHARVEASPPPGTDLLLLRRKTEHWGSPFFLPEPCILLPAPLLAEPGMNQLGQEKCGVQSPVQYGRTGQRRIGSELEGRNE